MKNWELAAEALFSGFLLSEVPTFADESVWLKTAHLSDEGAGRSIHSDLMAHSVLAVAIKALDQEAEAPVLIWNEFLNRVWNCSGSLRTRVEELDSFVARFLIHDDPARFLFDVCYTYWLSVESARGDLSEAWLSDEEMLADRGSELLTVLMYIQEVNASQLEADLNDFVDAFLTDEDFDLQDDLGVFEVLIQQAPTLDLSYAQLIRESIRASDDSPLQGLLPGLMCFFKDPGDPNRGIEPVFSARSSDRNLLPVYLCLMTALRSEWCFSPHLRPAMLQSIFFATNQAD